ncbi:hypothetical protein FRC17_010646 [Serendipita sp. 399]|nr:hypothetical protein FRC17_010646 [Serendipita sp. 399]
MATFAAAIPIDPSPASTSVAAVEKLLPHEHSGQILKGVDEQRHKAQAHQAAPQAAHKKHDHDEEDEEVNGSLGHVPASSHLATDEPDTGIIQHLVRRLTEEKARELSAHHKANQESLERSGNLHHELAASATDWQEAARHERQGGSDLKSAQKHFHKSEAYRYEADSIKHKNAADEARKSQSGLAADLEKQSRLAKIKAQHHHEMAERY